eukprot:1161398-Pelagomonas_calceolata.AAC.5
MGVWTGSIKFKSRSELGVGGLLSHSACVWLYAQYEDISGRPKNLYGIWQKMRSSGKSSLDQVYDVTALRVVVTNKHDCYVALRVVQEALPRVGGCP